MGDRSNHGNEQKCGWLFESVYQDNCSSGLAEPTKPLSEVTKSPDKPR